jgi:hypothetical protein
MSDTPDDLKDVKRIMGALVHMPPKHHDEMKLGKPRAAKGKNLFGQIEQQGLWKRKLTAREISALYEGHVVS